MATVTLKIKIDVPGAREEIEQVVKELKQKLAQFGELQIDTSDAANGLDNVNSKLNQTKQNAGGVRQAFAEWGQIITGYQSALTSLKQVFDVVTAPLDVAGNLEDYVTQFEVFSGSADRAKKLVQDLIDVSAKTPLTLNGMADTSKTLLNFGADINDVVDLVLMLGDVAGGNQERMSSLALAYGQMSSTGRLMGQDLLQMINAGFNPLNVIAEKTGKTIGELKKEMEEGSISSDMVTEAFKSATSEGGQFYQMMEKQSQGLKGLTSTFQDSGDAVLRIIGEEMLPVAKAALQELTALLQFTAENFDEIVVVLEVAASGVLAYTLSVNGAAIALQLYNTVTRIATALTVGFSTAIKSNPIGLLVSLITMAVVALGELTDWFGLTSESAEDTNKALQEQADNAADARLSISKLKDEFKELSDTKLKEALTEINTALEGTAISAQQREEFEAYQKAITELMSDRKKKAEQNAKDITELRIAAIKDEKERELAELGFWFKEQTQKYKGSEEALTSLKSIYSQKRAEIEQKYLDKETESKEKQIEKQYKLETTIIEATLEGKEKELSLLNIQREQALRDVEQSSAEELAIKELYDKKASEINQKYNDKEYKDNQENKEQELALVRQTLDAETAMREVQGESTINLAKMRYEEETRILNEMLEEGLISHEQYNNEVDLLYAKTFQSIAAEFEKYTSSIIDTAYDALTEKQQYSDEEVALTKLQHEQELESLKEQLAEGQITREEYYLRVKIAEQELAEYLESVEEDRATFLEKMWKSLTNYFVDELKKQAARLLASKLVEVAYSKTTDQAKSASYIMTETEKTAAFTAASATRTAVAAAESATLLSISTASLATMTAAVTAAMQVIAAAASTAATLVSISTLGAAAATGSASVIAALASVKAASITGFKKGGYTGDGSENEEAGVVHKNEYVFESALVNKEKSAFQYLHQLLRKGVTLTDLFQHVTDPMDALAGVSLVSPTLSGSYSNTAMSDIKSELVKLNNRMESIEKTGFNHKFEVDDIKEEIRGSNIYRVVKLRERIESKKIAEAS